MLFQVRADGAGAFLNGVDATAAQSGMLGGRANIGFPMPAAFTFLALGFADRGSDART